MENSVSLLSQAQEQIISRLVIDKSLYYRYSTILHEGLFIDSDKRRIFLAYQQLIKQSRTPDALNISQNVVGIDNAFLLVTKIISKINYNGTIEGYIDILVENYKQNSILKSIAVAKGKLDNQEPIANIVSFISSELINISNNNYKPIKLMSTHLGDMFKNIERNQNAQGLTGLGTGLTKYDTFSGGNHLSDLVIIAGSSSMGKTSLALTMARNTAIMFNNAVGILSLEMSVLQLVSRLASMESEISSKEILRGKLEQSTVDHLSNRISALAKAPIYIEHCAISDLQTICNTIRSMYIQYGIKQVIIDYIQLIAVVGNKNTNREEQLGEIARSFKNLAMELNINVTALSQLNRELTKRSSPEPKMSDLRGSGQLEEAADVILFPYRPEHYGISEFFDDSGQPAGSTIGKAELIIAKGRNIGTATMRLRFDKEFTRFSDEHAFQNGDTFSNIETLSTLQPNTDFTIPKKEQYNEDAPF